MDRFLSQRPRSIIETEHVPFGDARKGPLHFPSEDFRFWPSFVPRFDETSDRNDYFLLEDQRSRVQ